MCELSFWNKSFILVNYFYISQFNLVGWIVKLWNFLKWYIKLSINFVNWIAYVIITSMKVVFFAIIKLLLIIFLGFFLYRKKILTQEALKFLTFLVVNITVPFLIFTEIITHLNLENAPPLYKFILLSISIFSLGLFRNNFFSFL